MNNWIECATETFNHFFCDIIRHKVTKNKLYFIVMMMFL